MKLFKRAPAEEVYPRVDINDIIRTHEIVDYENGVMVVAPALRESTQLADPVYNGAEIGYSGPSSYGGYSRSEYNPVLRGALGLRKYNEMRRSDATVRSALRLNKTPILAARWFVQPATQSPRDVEIGNFVNGCFFTYMSTSFPQLLNEILLMLDYGYYVFEKVYDIRIISGQPRIVWKKLAPRHPLDISEWKLDANGGPDGIMACGPKGGPDVFIPIDKLLVFTNDKEANDIEGMSVLRSAYKHWYFKENLYKIDAIQKERHGVGIPIIKLPPNFNATDRNIAHQIGRNLRTNEKAHVVLPPNWDIVFADLRTTPVDALESANHHATMIYQNILAEFMRNGASGTDATTAQALFLKSTRYIADSIRDVFNKYAIPQLVDMNWPDVEVYPELRARRIGDTEDWRMITFALRNAVGANIIRPDDKLDEWLRDEMDLPMADPATARIPEKAPQGGTPTVGLPRQSGANNMKITPGKKAGVDSSGKSGPPR